jgi:glycosyltransferase involved in cell wall biosynthesis
MKNVRSNVNSVVIPTYNSERTLYRTLQALYSGTHKPQEVIVVDGYSRDSTVKVAHKFPVKVLYNPKVHAAAARNLGIETANGEIIAFTDSDCVPEMTWLERIYDHFKNNSALVGVGGIILPLPPENDIEAFSASVFLNEIMKFPSLSFSPDRKSLAAAFTTANCSYRKSALIEIGGFNEFFKNNGEDIDLYWRMLEKFPGRLLYDPSLIVYHSFPKSYSSLARKYIQYGIASSRLNKYHLKSPSIDYYIYKKLFKHLVRLLTPWERSKRTDLLYLTQLSSHIIGKIYGSIITKTINL